MQKKERDYSKTVIYQLVSNDRNIKEVYVGHTTNFKNRRTTHRNACYNPKHTNHNYYVYQYIRSHGGFENWLLVEIEKYPCKDKTEAIKKERYWAEVLQSTLNKQVPGRTQAEYYQDHKEYMNARSKLYYQQNKEAILRKRKPYTKQYHQDHKHTVAICDTFTCSCGGRYRKSNKHVHDQTLKHQTYINSLVEYEYYWDDGTVCTKEDYENSL